MPSAAIAQTTPALMAIAPTSLASIARSAAMKLSLSDAAIVTSDAKRSHLIWEKGFRARFLLSGAAISAVALGAQHSTEAWIQGMRVQSYASFLIQSLAHRLEWWSLLGLLSSSCCVLQLILNAFSFGCAGFNTYLGPTRPSFLALTLFLQSMVWRTALTAGGLRMVGSAAGGTLLCLVLTFLPEALHLYVHRKRGGGVDSSATAVAVAAAASGAAIEAGGDATAGAETAAAEVCLTVNGMGCTACTAKVQGALESVPGVAAASVTLETGSASVRVARDADAGVEQRAIAALVQAGFEASMAE